jgi:class 3 adenylate cyclase
MTGNEGVTKILNLTAEQMDRAAELDKLRRNITVLFTDLKGSTSYFEKFGDSAGLLMVHRCNTMLAEAVERQGGKVIKTIGDAVMASFENNAEAIAAAIEMQEAIAADNAGKSGAEKISIRIGINYGLGIVKSNDVFGDVVNVASRVEGAASPEQILISLSLYEAIKGDNRFRIRPFGSFALKGKSQKLELFEVQWRPGDPQAPVVAHSMIMPVLDFSQQVKIRLMRDDHRTNVGRLHLSRRYADAAAALSPERRSGAALGCAFGSVAGLLQPGGLLPVRARRHCPHRQSNVRVSRKPGRIGDGQRAGGESRGVVLTAPASGRGVRFDGRRPETLQRARRPNLVGQDEGHLHLSHGYRHEPLPCQGLSPRRRLLHRRYGQYEWHLHHGA